VLVEKPLELTVARGEQLVAAGHRQGGRSASCCNTASARPACGCGRCWKPATLGTVEAASMTVPWWRPQSYYDEPGRGTMARDGGGVLLTQAIHTLDLFRSLVGISAITAAEIRTTSLHRMETEDYAARCCARRMAPRHADDHHRLPARPPGADRDHRRPGAATLWPAAGWKSPMPTGSAKWWRRKAPPAAAPTSWTFPHDAHRAVLKNFFEACVTGQGLVVSA
jgi:hypothetical protein